MSVIKIKKIAKRIFFIFSILLLSPFILLVRLGKGEFFNIFANGISIFPGMIGSYLRVAFYFCTCKKISPDIFIGFGSYFSRREVEVGMNSSIGAYCIIGSVNIGREVLIASRVSIPSGRHQHGTAEDGHAKWEKMEVDMISIGDKSWIGEGALILADVGEKLYCGRGKCSR